MPDDYRRLAIPLIVPDGRLMEVTSRWINRYFELIQFGGNLFGRRK